MLNSFESLVIFQPNFLSSDFFISGGSSWKAFG